MTVDEAVKIIDENIPEPGNKMVDGEHLKIAVAWQTIKKTLSQGRNDYVAHTE
ncbi:MAG: hypothetical protein LIO54_08335 [Oscillospiraceae bacterium]|nr:hypothetical protein [Oscillospiraceae bacterium]